MAVEHLKGSRVITTMLGSAPVSKVDGSLNGANFNFRSETVEVTAAASDTSTYHLFRVGSHERISGFLSQIGWDDLASSGAPTLDIGAYDPEGSGTNFTDDVDAFNDGLDAATATAAAKFVKNLADHGKQVWEFISGLTADPRCEVDIKVVIDDADCNTGGTIMAELVTAEAK